MKAIKIPLLHLFVCSLSDIERCLFYNLWSR